MLKKKEKEEFDNMSMRMKQLRSINSSFIEKITKNPHD